VVHSDSGNAAIPHQSERFYVEEPKKARAEPEKQRRVDAFARGNVPARTGHRPAATIQRGTITGIGEAVRDHCIAGKLEALTDRKGRHIPLSPELDSLGNRIVKGRYESGRSANEGPVLYGGRESALETPSHAKLDTLRDRIVKAGYERSLSATEGTLSASAAE